MAERVGRKLAGQQNGRVGGRAAVEDTSHEPPGQRDLLGLAGERAAAGWGDEPCTPARESAFCLMGTSAPAPGTAAAMSAGDPVSSVRWEEARRHAGTGHPAVCVQCEPILVASRPAWPSDGRTIPDCAFRMAA
jgi:hypothetical protein